MVDGAVGTAQRVQALLRAGEVDEATLLAGDALRRVLGAPIKDLHFTLDAYSLNSVSGLFTSSGGEELFFKFHTEEGEEASVGEYYRAELLASAGLPVDVPVHSSNEPGEQFVIYRRRTERRMADVCLAIERSEGAAARLPTGLLAAQQRLDGVIGAVLVRTLAAPTADSATISLHQLFHTRLTDAGVFPGGRYAKWYLAESWFESVADSRWTVDGTTLDGTLRTLGERMSRELDPRRLAEQPVTTAHGDDHQGNIWVESAAGGVTLSLFDPAFASDRIPALLAPVKATYHNVFAHPLWLYHPAEARWPDVATQPGEVTVTGAGFGLSPLRKALLGSLTESVWNPLLCALRDAGTLPTDWRSILRSALAACPLLVTNLISPVRPDAIKYLGLAHVMSAGFEPTVGSDPVSEWLDGLTAALA